MMTEFVDFVEKKSIPTDELLEVLQPSIQQNRHTNFGPVSECLEQNLTGLNGGFDGHVACCVTNATLGLQAAVSTFENTVGRRLRWVISDFSFFTSFIGPFHDQTHIPCRADGMISMAALEQVPPDDYDAILATNVFGLHEDFSDIFEFARTHRKILLIDNAAGFRALAPFHAPSGGDDDFLWAEVVSFHHTKPWGMGEGGAVFLPKALAATFRAAINFGAGGGRQLTDDRLCTNGKMSELAAAQILLRVRAYESWSPAFREQAERLLALGQAAGLQPLITHLPSRAVPGQIPFLCKRPVTLDQLENPVFRIRKYYQPARQSGQQARAIFDRILSLPCHTEMAGLSDDVIITVLKSIQATS